MKIHEHQAKEIFEQYNIPTPQGKVAYTPDEVYQIAKEIGKKVVVKAQVHVGGRGKAGGVKLADTADQAKEIAKQILGMDIKGLTVKKVLVVEAVDIKKELYVGLIMDRGPKKVTIMVSEAGGVDIEEVAAKTPEKILKAQVDPLLGVKGFQVRRLFENIFKEKDQLKTALSVTEKLYQIFMDKDCSLVEINPFAVLGDGRLIAADAKITFDENALGRHPDIEKLMDMDSVDPNEVIANKYGLSFVQLDGNVGCIVNGAGLAMATMDGVKLYNGEPANFLDVGGSSNPQKVVKALEIIMSNKNIKSILFNIFGGITRCDDIANGILEALDKINIPIPIIVRLTGTNEAAGREILKKSGKDLIPAETMNEAVKLAVEQAKS
ncbi:MAG TPA: ADP-forming succinate--CoA ligase subunit beta [Spirochaetes bacterium]|nr:ADP-forming succinate--CoA ligase subunit beta [Spirochaetota bacterium]